MIYQYVFELRAQEEYETSLEWYLDRSLQAASDFISSIDEALLLICEHPKRWKNQYKNYYEFGLKKFSFHIIYTIDDKNKRIIIFSVYHHKRNPKRKYNRNRKS
ncbi:MAG: type II toxin-antitoxin system RelE/ParE family toxin [Chitinophagales bacterium]